MLWWCVWGARPTDDGGGFGEVKETAWELLVLGVPAAVVLLARALSSISA